jgi:hypothetical protein
MGSRIRKILLDTVPPPPPVKVTGTLALTGGATAKSGNPMTFRATRTGGSDGYVRVNWSVTGGVCSPASGFFEWPDGVTTQQTVTVTATTTAVPVSGVLYIYGPTSDIGLVPPLGLSSANVTVTVPAVIEGPTRWAEIPEIVFVRGMSETEEMGIYYLDPSNLTATGDLWWLEDRRLKDETGADYVPRVPFESVGSLPVGVTLNAFSGELTYSAAADTIPLTGAHSRTTIRLKAGDAVSEPFMVSVLRPTIVWGYGAEAVAAQYGAAWGDPNLGHTWKLNVGTILKATNAWDTDPNVVYWTPGDYDGEENSTWTLATPPWNLYLIGALGETRTRCAQYSGAFNTVARVTYKRIDSFDIGLNFNFGLKQAYFDDVTGVVYDTIGTISQCYMRDYIRSGTLVNGETLFEHDMDNTYAPKSDAHYPAVGKLFASNMLLYNNTSTSTKHHFYVHGRGRCYLIINNARVGGGSPCSGIKFTTRYARIRNSWVSALEDNSTVLVNGDRNVKLIDGAACCEVTLFNMDLWGCYRIPELQFGGTQEMIYWRNRNSRGGCDEPAAPTFAFYFASRDPLAADYEPLPGDPAQWKTGFRAWSRGYQSDVLNGWSGSPETYWSNDFYDAVLQYSLSDPQNPYTFKKYVSHTRFHWMQEGTYPPKTPLRDDGFWPQFTTYTNGPNYRMSVPKNWIDRSVTFMANNRFIGWTTDNVNYRKADLSGALRSEQWIDVNATGDDSIDIFVGPVDADHDHTVNIPGRTEGSLNVLNDPRTVVFVGGDTGPHPEAVVPVDGSGIPTGPDQPIELPDWFKI